MVSRFWKQRADSATLDLSASTWSAYSFGFFPSNQNVNYRLRTPTRCVYSWLCVFGWWFPLSVCVCVCVCVCGVTTYLYKVRIWQADRYRRKGRAHERVVSGAGIWLIVHKIPPAIVKLCEVFLKNRRRERDRLIISQVLGQSALCCLQVGLGFKCQINKNTIQKKMLKIRCKVATLWLSDSTPQLISAQIHQFV